MLIRELSFRDFRNYEQLQLSNLEGLVIFCGPNAVGKTNVLEGIHLLTAAQTFRHAQIAQIIRKNQQTALVKALISDGNRQIEHSCSLEAGKKRFCVNGKPKQATEVRGTLPAVAFVPDDLELAKKSSSVKRAALDNLGVQLSKNYGVVHRDYERALRYKNRLLKDESPAPLIEAINETLVTVAAQLYCYRRALFERMAVFTESNYADLAQSGERFGAHYQPSWVRLAERYAALAPLAKNVDTASDLQRDQVKEILYRAVDLLFHEEIRQRRSLVGPHNDQISFFLDGNDASIFASQGQQRSIVLAWKLAEVQQVRQTVGVNPVLLLDDVMSELDEMRRAHLVKAVSEDIQTFITATDLTPFDQSLVNRAQVFNFGPRG